MDPRANGSELEASTSSLASMGAGRAVPEPPMRGYPGWGVPNGSAVGTAQGMGPRAGEQPSAQLTTGGGASNHSGSLGNLQDPRRLATMPEGSLDWELRRLVERQRHALGSNAQAPPAAGLLTERPLQSGTNITKDQSDAVLGVSAAPQFRDTTEDAVNKAYVQVLKAEAESRAAKAEARNGSQGGNGPTGGTAPPESREAGRGGLPLDAHAGALPAAHRSSHGRTADDSVMAAEEGRAARSVGAAGSGQGGAEDALNGARRHNEAGPALGMALASSIQQARAAWGAGRPEALGGVNLLRLVGDTGPGVQGSADQGRDATSAAAKPGPTSQGLVRLGLAGGQGGPTSSPSRGAAAGNDLGAREAGGGGGGVGGSDGTTAGRGGGSALEATIRALAASGAAAAAAASSSRPAAQPDRGPSGLLDRLPLHGVLQHLLQPNGPNSADVLDRLLRQVNAARGEPLGLATQGPGEKVAGDSGAGAAGAAMGGRAGGDASNPNERARNESGGNSLGIVRWDWDSELIRKLQQHGDISWLVLGPQQRPIPSEGVRQRQMAELALAGKLAGGLPATTPPLAGPSAPVAGRVGVDGGGGMEGSRTGLASGRRMDLDEAPEAEFILQLPVKMPPEVAQDKKAKKAHVEEQLQRQTDQLLALVQATKNAPGPPKPTATEWVLGGQEWTLNVPTKTDQTLRDREGGLGSVREADRDRDREPDGLAVERERDRERGARELAGGQPRGNSRPARQQHISSSGAGPAAGPADGGAGAGTWGSKGPTGLQLLRSLVSSGTAGVGVAGLLNGGATALNLAGLTGGACDQLLEDLQAFGVIKKGGAGGGAGGGGAPAATGPPAGDAGGRGGPVAVGAGGVGSGSGYGPPAGGAARSRLTAGIAVGDTLGGREPPAREQVSPQQAAQPPRKPNKRPENGSLATQILKRQRLQEEQAAAIAGSGSGGGSGGVAGGSILASLGQAGASGLLLGGAGGVAAGGLGGLPGAGGVGAIGGGNGMGNALYRLAMQSSPSAISAILDAAGPLGVSGTPLNALTAALAARRGGAGAAGSGGTLAGSIAELLAQHGAAGLPAAALGLAGGTAVGMGGGAGALAALGGAAGAGGAPPQALAMLRDLPITDALLTGLKRVGPLTVALGVPVPKRKRSRRTARATGPMRLRNIMRDVVYPPPRKGQPGDGDGAEDGEDDDGTAPPKPRPVGTPRLRPHPAAILPDGSPARPAWEAAMAAAAAAAAARGVAPVGVAGVQRSPAVPSREAPLAGLAGLDLETLQRALQGAAGSPLRLALQNALAGAGVGLAAGAVRADGQEGPSPLINTQRLAAALAAAAAAGARGGADVSAAGGVGLSRPGQAAAAGGRGGGGRAGSRQPSPAPAGLGAGRGAGGTQANGRSGGQAGSAPAALPTQTKSRRKGGAPSRAAD